MTVRIPGHKPATPSATFAPTAENGARVTANDDRAKISRGTPLDAARESILVTPVWLPLAVAILAIVVLDIVVPRTLTGPITVLATLGGAVLAFACVAFVWYRRQSKSRMRSLVRSLTTVDAVNHMSPGEVHDLVVAALLRRGWHMSDDLPGGAPADVVVMTSDRVRRAIFFLTTRDPISAANVRELESQIRGRARALLVSAGRYGPEAIVCARQIGVELVDGQGVLTLMTELRGEAKAFGPLPAPTFVWEDEVLAGHVQRPAMNSAGANSERQCPDCGSSMKAHQNSTTRYWACSRFPDCSGMIIIQ